MKREVLTYNEVIGFHNYPDAPKWCSYLGHRHRHVFVIRCRFEVSHNEREIEINEQQLQIDNFLHLKYGSPCEFKGMSCESIAEVLIEQFKCTQVEVLEDGYGGAALTR